MISWRF